MTIMAIRGVSLFVKVMGQGYPLLLMHGGPGQDHTSLLSLQPCADQYTMIFYDHRCNGRSEGAELASMTWENLTADADALRQALGFDRWAVLGHSFGGMVALEYALRYPDSLSHLLLMDTCGDASVHENAPEILAERGYGPNAVEAARRFYSGQLTPGEYFPTVMRFSRAYFYHFSLLKTAYDIVFGPRVKLRPETTIYGFNHLYPGWTVMDRLNEITVPTLVFAGRHDFLFPPEHQALLAAGISNATLKIIECAGHNPQMEQAAEVIEVIKDFLSH
jgi:proline-specific peptidase